jgi:uncharacterized membrane protein
MVWRQRLDMTTNWAITSSTAIITIAFSTRDVPHIIFFFNLAIVAVLLWIEARRYRFYDAFRARVRMLEAHFLVPMVMENRELLQGEWKKLVCEDLILPCFKITKLEAIGRRMKRNYMFIFILILIAWLTKDLFARQRADQRCRIVLSGAAHRTHPVVVVAMVFVGTFISVISITIYVSKRSSGEISEFGTHARSGAFLRRCPMRKLVFTREFTTTFDQLCLLRSFGFVETTVIHCELSRPDSL